MATKKLSQLTRSTQPVLMVPALLDNHAGGFNNVITDERYLLTPTEVQTIRTDISTNQTEIQTLLTQIQTLTAEVERLRVLVEGP